MKPDKEWQTVAWWSAFREQLTKKTVDAAARVAEVELARLYRLGFAAPWGAEDLVQQLVLAISEGECAWSPEAFPLRRHLCHKVRQATRALRDPRRPPRIEIPLDGIHDDDPVWAEPALASDGAGAAEVRDLAQRVEGELWRRCADDPVALQVLQAMSEGAHGEREIATVLGLPREVVWNATRRIQRVVLGLPAPLVQDVREALSLEASTDGGL